MSPSNEPVDVEHIAASNVRPAYEASLAFGASEPEIERVSGMTRELLESDGATVTGLATYAHMELMFTKPKFAEFLVAAAASHTPRSLGVVGLAAKTAPTLGAALACHHRYQHLTNRTAVYASEIDDARFVLHETRYGEPRLGSHLVSDYALLIAIALVRDGAQGDATPVAMHSRRAEIDPQEKAVYEAFAEAPVVLGAPHAMLVFRREVGALAVASADAELADYFAGVLEAADQAGDVEDPAEPALVRRVRRAIRDGLVHGTPSAPEVAARLALGSRTLQRRLAAAGTTFGELLESTRQRLARGYLADPNLSVAEVAYLLGYREQASFFRAFRRWTGQTPASYRRGDTA